VPADDALAARSRAETPARPASRQLAQDYAIEVICGRDSSDRDSSGGAAKPKITLGQQEKAASLPQQ